MKNEFNIAPFDSRFMIKLTARAVRNCAHMGHHSNLNTRSVPVPNHFQHNFAILSQDMKLLTFGMCDVFRQFCLHGDRSLQVSFPEGLVWFKRHGM
jgi:hypothetical protein